MWFTTGNMAEQRYPESGLAYRNARISSWVGSEFVSQERLAAAVGTNRRHIIRLENGENRPRADLRDRIARYLGVDPASLPAAGEDPFRSSDTEAHTLSSHGFSRKFTGLFKRRST